MKPLNLKNLKMLNLKVAYKRISFILFLVIASLIVYYVSKNIDDFKKILDINPMQLIVLICLFLIFIFNNGLVIKYLLEPFKIRLRVLEALGLSVVTTFYNLISPVRGGTFVRALYLKKRHKFPDTNFVATVSGIYIINFFVGCLFGLFSLVIIHVYYGFFSQALFWALLISSIFLLAIILFSPSIKETKNYFLNLFIKAINGWHIIRKNKRVVFITSSFTLVQLVIYAAIIAIVYNTLDVSVNAIKSLFLSSMAYLSGFITITPAALGVTEAVSVFSALIISITPSQALSAAILIRVISSAIVVLLGPLFSYRLIRSKK